MLPTGQRYAHSHSMVTILSQSFLKLSQSCLKIAQNMLQSCLKIQQSTASLALKLHQNFDIFSVIPSKDRRI